MAVVMPGDIKTEPNYTLVFNSPFSEKNRCPLTITNLGTRRMGWAIKTNNMKRLCLDPRAGALDPKERQIVYVSCEPFNFDAEDIANDQITLDWINTPEGAAKHFRREWFEGEGMIRRKKIPVQYNP